MTNFEKVRRSYVYSIVVFLGMGLGNALIPVNLLAGALVIGLTGIVLLPAQPLVKNPLRREPLEERKRLLAPYKISPIAYALPVAACLLTLWWCVKTSVRDVAIFNALIAAFLLTLALINLVYVLRMKPAPEAP